MHCKSSNEAIYSMHDRYRQRVVSFMLSPAEAPHGNRTVLLILAILVQKIETLSSCSQLFQNVKRRVCAVSACPLCLGRSNYKLYNSWRDLRDVAYYLVEMNIVRRCGWQYFISVSECFVYLMDSTLGVCRWNTLRA